jgi:Asp-tRNA(Asn)/Glu-tRNA(Gln) amidotransferase A subunit family amidase
MRPPSIAQYHSALKNGDTTVARTVSAFLSRIADNQHLNAFLEVYGDHATARAKELDATIANGTFGKLTGVVIGIKDNICFEGFGVQGSSKILNGFTSLYSATVIERLLAEGAIIIGRLNCDEMAMGSSTENSAFGNTLNPIDNARVPAVRPEVRLRLLLLAVPCGAGFGHRRLNTPTRFILRYSWCETHLRPGFAVWSLGLRFQF